MKKIIGAGFLGALLILLSCSMSPENEIIPAMSGGLFIAGHVYDQNMNPVVGAVVKMYHPYEPGPQHSQDFHLCGQDATDAEGYYCISMAGHEHGEDGLGKCIPPPGSGLTTQQKKIYIPDDFYREVDETILVDWILLPPR